MLQSIFSHKALLSHESRHRHTLFNIFLRAEGVQPMAWATRMQIALDIARGLSFLHSLNANIIYRDLKASNILIDSVC